MIAFGHTGIGIGVGLGTYYLLGDSNPTLTLLTAGSAGFVSHYLADLVPHGHFTNFKDYKSKVWKPIVFDLGLTFLIVFVLSYFKFGFSLKTWSILFGIGGAQLPDVIDGLMYLGLLPIKGPLKLENKLHILTHWHGKFEKGLMWDLKRDIYQVIIYLLALLLIIKW